MEEQVILVNEQDEAIGTMEKMEAHHTNSLHRAISVLIYNAQGEMLLQKRATDKYHSPGLWTNACCSHPRPGESVHEAAHRRLKEEMGMSCDLRHAFHFIYQCELDKGLSEHELDHVFIGNTDQAPQINTDEAMDWKYISMEQLQHDIQTNPGDYTHWFKIILNRLAKNALG